MFTQLLESHIQCFQDLKPLAPVIQEAGGLLFNTLRGGGKILVCGNGGSAADAQHFAAEIVGRFEKERRAYPAIALTTDSSILTAIANDYAYDAVFSRQVEGLGSPGDALLGISTSGTSANVARAVETAAAMGIQTIGLCGRDGGHIAQMVDHAVTISQTTTARIQEAHIFILHYWAWQIENGLISS